jgi:FRG domain-containing protein
MREARRVWTVEEFLRKVSSIREEWVAEEGDLPEWLPWFRGEANARWATRLKPRLYRREAARTKRHTRRLLYADQEIRLGFLRSAAQLVSGRALDKWERYFLMQAYGAPTRLLDWTDGALPALYFAVGSRGRDGDTAGDADAAVYVLDPWLLNQKTFSRGRRPQSEGVALSEWPQAARYLPDEFDSERLRPKIPLAIDPVHLAGRMAAQRAHFTIFGRDLDGLVSCSTRGRVCLVKIPIASAAIPKIQEQLKLAGITASTLFPDMEGLGRELSYLWDELVRRIH